MENFWNIIHFFAYKFMTKSYLIFVKPVKFLSNTSLSKKLLARNGRTPEIALKDFTFTLMDKRVGQSSFWAAGIVFAIPFIICFSLELLYVSFVDNSLPIEMFIGILIIYAVVIGLINYFLLFRHDKYLKYFKKFEKQPREWNVKWAWISAGVILFPFLVLIGSFIAM